jgi:hypothetical protein
MSNMTKYGSFAGNIPANVGRVFWVAPSASYIVDGKYYDSSDENDGLSPDKALRRVNRAWALCTANIGDTIVLLPGDHSAANTAGTATSVAASVAGVTMMGLPCSPGAGNPYRKRTTLTCAAADETVNVTAADIQIANITFIGDVLNTGSPNLDFSAAADRLHIHDCTVDVTAQTANTGIDGFSAIGAAENVLIEGCVFHIDGAFGPAVDMSATTDSVVQDCIVSVQTGTLAVGMLTGAAGRLYLRRNQFNAHSGTITAGIDGTGATVANGIVINDNKFSVNNTKEVDTFDSAEAVLSENYKFTIGGGAGFALVVVIT